MSATGIAVYSTVIQGLALLAILCLLGAVIMGPMSFTTAGRRSLARMFSDEMEPVKWALSIAATGMLGSLYLSEIVGFVPCRLCWFQRGVMYPLVPILAALIWKRRAGGWMAVLPIALIGASISGLHIFEQFHPEIEVVSCGEGVPCSARYVAVFGWISIPVLAGSAFLAIATLMLVTRALRKVEGNVAPAPQPPTVDEPDHTR